MTWLSRGLDTLYPPKCALCARIGEAVMCVRCLDSFVRLPVDPEPIDGPVSRQVAFAEYHGRAAQAVQRLKYNRVTSHANLMSEQLVEVVAATGLDQVDAVVPVPIHWTRHCLRGFNQSDLLAAAFPEVRPKLLVRVRATRPQVGLDPEARLHNLRGAFRATPEVSGLAVLLLDDVTTSGGTARECAVALREGGAREVFLATYAAGDGTQKSADPSGSAPS